MKQIQRFLYGMTLAAALLVAASVHAQKSAPVAELQAIDGSGQTIRIDFSAPLDRVAPQLLLTSSFEWPDEHIQALLRRWGKTAVQSAIANAFNDLQMQKVKQLHEAAIDDPNSGFDTLGLNRKTLDASRAAVAQVSPHSGPAPKSADRQSPARAGTSSPAADATRKSPAASQFEGEERDFFAECKGRSIPIWNCECATTEFRQARASAPGKHMLHIAKEIYETRCFDEQQLGQYYQNTECPKRNRRYEVGIKMKSRTARPLLECSCFGKQAARKIVSARLVTFSDQASALIEAENGCAQQ